MRALSWIVLILYSLLFIYGIDITKDKRLKAMVAGTFGIVIVHNILLLMGIG